MSTYAWPSDDAVFVPTRMEILQRHNNRALTSSLSGYTQTTSIPGARWGLVLEFGRQPYTERQRLEAFLTRLSGMEHRAQIWDFARPVPLGSINLGGVTASAAAQFATSIELNGCGNATTLKAGDWFSVVTSTGVQLLMCVADATASAGGVMTVTVRQMLRGTVTGSAAVVLEKPTALYILSEPQWSAPRSYGNEASPLTVEFIEVFA